MLSVTNTRDSQVIVLESHGSSLKMRLPAAGEEQLPELFAALSKEPMGRGCLGLLAQKDGDHM